MESRAELIVRGGTVLAMSAGAETVTHADVAIAGGEIVGIDTDIAVPDGCEIIDAADRIVMPGLVDTHTHMWNGLWRSYADTGGPASAYGALGMGMGRLYTPEDSYVAVLGVALEMIAAGVTTVHNWAHNMVSPEHAEAELMALRDAGIRARFSYGYHWNLAQTALMPLDDVVQFRDRWNGGLIDVGMALRNDTTQGTVKDFFAALSVDPALLREEMAAMRENRVPLTMHIRNPGPASYFIDAGYIAPDNVIVHGYHWSGDEWRILADAGIRISLSPHSCLAGLHQLMPLGDIIASGAPAGLSFDHMNGSGNADMFRLMQLALLNEALRDDDGITPLTAIGLATLGGAEVLGLGDRTGSITLGKRADLLLLDSEALSMVPLHDVPTAVANSANPSIVDTVIVDGVVLKRGGELLHWDRHEVARSVDRTFRGLRERYESAASAAG